MGDSDSSSQHETGAKTLNKAVKNFVRNESGVEAAARSAPRDLEAVVRFLGRLIGELDSSLDPNAPNPFLNMSLYLIRSHLEAKPVNASSMISASGVPYATATRKLAQMQQAGLIEQRRKTRTGKSYSLHPSPKLLDTWSQLADRISRIGQSSFGHEAAGQATSDYFFGGSYMPGRTLIQPPQVLQAPLKLAGGLRVLVHGDPTFMVMDNLKRQFEQIVGTNIVQRAFSIDRLHEEALRNAQHANSQYDLIAVDLPWIGEFVEKGVLRPLDSVMDINRLDPGDFHTAGWRAAHWNGRPYGAPSQTTPELLFYRTDVFAKAGLKPPATTDEVLQVARALHNPKRGRYGVAWNAARGTALGHTFMMTCADFGQPILNMEEIAGGFKAYGLGSSDIEPTIDTPRALEACEYLQALLSLSPPDILSMSWYERVRPYGAGKIAMAYGYTLLAPYFELDSSSPACGRTGYLPHPHGPSGAAIAPIGGYVLGIPANLPPERLDAAVEALIAFTSPEAQKLYVQNGSRTAPRYSVGADPEVRRLSPIFEAVDHMSWRDELQFWPRPPIPEISAMFSICGQEIHDMLRGEKTPRAALADAQLRAEQILKRQPT